MDLWVINPTNGARIAVVDTYHRIEWSRRYWQPGELLLNMETWDLVGTGIAKGRFLWVQDDHDGTGTGHLYIIEKVEIDTAAVSPPVEIVGRDVGVYLNHRLVLPDVGQSHDAITDNVETVMLHYIDRAVGPGADAVDEGRTLPNVTIGVDQGRGDVVEAAGLRQFTGDFIDAIGQTHGFGWEAVWDINTGEIEFVVRVGVDRSDTVFIDPEFETAQSIQWLQSMMESKTWALVGGQGEYEDRETVAVYIGDEEPTGYDRREMFVDARDLDDPALLPTRGAEALIETDEADVFRVVITPNGSFSYPTDFDLGDRVTVRSEAFGLDLSARIVGVRHAAGADVEGERETTLEIGQFWPTWKRRVGQEMTVRPSATGRV